ncbi:MAG TPA: hypothetical protein VLT61_17540 [Anaeromyxobacteraceae bacterium]|nr:hypothetical protein [Anaeromyxobacteraceae bacterium]
MRISIEERRREVDAILREDARRFPYFARARFAAVMAACEWGGGHFFCDPDGVRRLLASLRAREDGTEIPPGGGPWDWEAHDVYMRMTTRAAAEPAPEIEHTWDAWALP